MFDCDKLNPSDQHDFSRLKYHISVQKYINMLASLQDTISHIGIIVIILSACQKEPVTLIKLFLSLITRIWVANAYHAF